MYELIQYGILTVICTFIVIRYSAPSVTFHVKFWAILTCVLNFALALLVPEDIYQSMLNPNIKTPQKQRISTQYLILYWTVYLLTWTIIPVLQEWQNSGDLSSSDRLKRSLKVNGLFYLWMVVGGALVLVLLIFFNVGGDMGLMTYLKCLATCWGIFLEMVMLGFALVQIPRSFWVEGHPQKNLWYCYKKIPQIQQQMSNAFFEFKQICAYIFNIKQIKKQDKQIQTYCEVCLQQIPNEIQSQVLGRYNDYLTHENYLQNYPIGLQSAIEHHRLLKRIIARTNRLKKNLAQFIDEAILYQDIIAAQKQNRQLVSNVVHVTPLKSLWHLKIKPFLYKGAAVFFIFFGIIITLAQTQVFLTNKYSFLGGLLLIDNLKLMRFLVYILIGIISYMVYYSLFKVKLSNIYGMYKNGSDGPSIMFATINFSRVGVAIVLNFFDMIKLNSIYKDAMGTVNMGLLGEWVIKGIPGVLWLIILCHYFDLWGKCVKKFKLSDDLKFNTHIFDEDQKPPIPYLVTERKKQLTKNPKRNDQNQLKQASSFGNESKKQIILPQINLKQRFI